MSLPPPKLSQLSGMGRNFCDNFRRRRGGEGWRPTGLDCGTTWAEPYACAVLQVRDLQVEVGGVVLLDGVSFTVRARDKVGLVGRNGAGKTSLLKVLGGQADPTAGVVHRTGGLGYLPQDPRLDGVPDDLPALDHVLSGRGFDEAAQRFEKLRLRIEEDPSDRNVDRYTRAEERFRMDGGYQADSEVRRLAAGLGLADDRLDLPLGVLSGGERRRVELVRILFAGSDVLLLDEPTNHLDTDAKEWMLDFLRAYQGALLVISHDLDLLDEAITRVLHLDRAGHDETGTMVEYKGTYTQYLASRARDEERLAKLAAAAGQGDRPPADRRRPLRGQGHQGVHGPQHREAHRPARSRPGSSGPSRQQHLNVRFPEPPRSPRTVLEVDGLAKSYGANDVFADVDFDLGRGDRLLIMGLNGAGKTSLLRILAGVTDADAGAVGYGPGVLPGYYAQEHEGITAGRTLVGPHAGGRHRAPATRRCAACSACSASPATRSSRTPSTLSGGEKTKLALAQLVAGRHNLLLLDEPTNNLDPGSREAMADGAQGLARHDHPGQPRCRLRPRPRPRPGPAHARRAARPLARRSARPGGDGVISR